MRCGRGVSAIEAIAADAIAHCDPQRFWPRHPQDGEATEDGNASLYIAATGVIWALDHLASAGATKACHDFRPGVSRLLEAVREQFPAYNYGSLGSLHFGGIPGRRPQG